MFGFKSHIDSMVMRSNEPGADSGGGGGWLGWVEEYRKRLEELKNDKAARDALGLTDEKIRQLEMLDELGALTPTLAQKLLFGEDGIGGSGSSRLASDDPRYWANLDRQFQLELAKLGLDAQNIGLDSEATRQQVLASLIANRNNTATDVASVAASVAKQIADYSANPRDAVAELIYRNQVGGVAPFADTNNSAFGEYGKALAQKAQSIFQPVGADLDRARTYRDSIPPTEFFGPETRQQLSLQPTAAQRLAAGGGSGTSLPASTAPAAANPLVALVDRLKAMAPEEQERFRTYVTGGQYQPPTQMLPPPLAGTTIPTPPANYIAPQRDKVPQFAEGGKLDFGGIFEGRAKDGFSPASSEGGTNLNIHERAVIVGESGQIYGTLGEKRPDGTIRAEQLIIKPLPSEVKKDKKLEEAEKQKVESQKNFMASFAEGGTVSATPEDFMQQLSQLLSGYGGAGGGTQTPLGGGRHLVGAPANALMDDPVLRDYTDAAYSAKGIDPRTLWADIARFTPSDARYRGQTTGRVNYL